MEVDRNGLLVLSRGQCLRLLKRTRIGRVVLSVDALPFAFPVNFAMLDDDVVFRTAPGTKLSAAYDGAILGFQADRVDPLLDSGWSVLVQGRASVLTYPDDIERARRLGLRPLAPGTRPHFVRVRTEVVSGRRFLSPMRAIADSFGPEEEAAERTVTSG